MEFIFKDRSDIYSPLLFDYIKALSEKMGYECYIDNGGSIVVHKIGNGERILIPFLVIKEELLITDVNDKKADYVSSSNIEIKDNTEVYSGEESIGCVANKIIEIYNDKSLRKGDKVHLNCGIECKANKLYGRNLNSNISLNLAVNLISEKTETDKDIYFTISFCKNTAKTLAKSIEPDYIHSFICNKISDNFTLSNGFGIAYKDNGAVISKDIIDLYLKASKDIQHQKYFGKTDSLTEFYLNSSGKVKAGTIVIPIKNMNTVCEITSTDDIEAALAVYKNLLQNEV